jgi:hypothetical protein
LDLVLLCYTLLSEYFGENLKYDKSEDQRIQEECDVSSHPQADPIRKPIKASEKTIYRLNRIDFLSKSSSAKSGLRALWKWPGDPSHSLISRNERQALI